jgi:hypothetical protein
MSEKSLVKRSLILLILGLLTGCASVDTRTPKNPDPIIKGEVTMEKAERALQMKLTKYMSFHEQNIEQYKKEVVKLTSGGDTSYYYKYYDEFPEGPENANISVTETDEFSPMFRAEVRYRKIRYQTRYTKSESKAKKDTDFIRDHGTQNEEYEFDGEVWRLKSSIFEVTRTSVYDRDRWNATQDRIRRVEEEKPELFVDKVRSLFGLMD